jgi:diacylglycerol O-acyltransferase
MGRNAVHLLPIPPIALRLRTGIAMLSYANELAFGITADFDAVPDVEELSRDIERGLARAWSPSATNGWDPTPPPDRRVLSGRHEWRATITGMRAD